MKKSVLWAAAGVVTATAIWAALSLPQHPSTPAHAITATPLPATSTRLFSELHQVRVLDRGVCILSYLGTMPPDDLKWDGKTLAVTAGNLQVRKAQTSPTTELALNLEYSYRKSRPHFSSAGMGSTTIVLHPGSAFPIRLR